MTAFLLGLQTSVSPCPLTANITAISYIGRQAGQSRSVLWSGLLYAAGQTAAYTLLAFCVTGLSLYSGSEITRFGTATLHRLMPVFLVVIGIILLGSGKTNRRTAERAQDSPTKEAEEPDNSENGAKNRAKNEARPFPPCESSPLAVFSAFPLGVFYAWAFCPTTAAMFLAMLALAVEEQSPFAVPFSFGLGTALPVVMLAYLLTFSTRYFAQTFHVLERLDAYSRPLTGAVFITAGIVLRLL